MDGSALQAPWGTLRRRENERRGCPPTPDAEHRNGAGKRAGANRRKRPARRPVAGSVPPPPESGFDFGCRHPVGGSLQAGIIRPAMKPVMTPTPGVPSDRHLAEISRRRVLITGG